MTAGAGTRTLDPNLAVTLTSPRRLAVLILLLLLTVLAVQLCPPYQVFGPELLVNPDFRQGLAGWEQTGQGEVQLEGGVLTLESASGATGLGLRQTLAPGDHRLLALSGQLAAREIVPGERPWQRGRLVLASLDGEGRRLPGPHLVTALAGSRDWQDGQAVLPVPEQARTLRVQVQLLKATGQLQARHISLRQARPNPAFQLLQMTAALTWTGGLLWLAWPLLSRLRPRPLDLLITSAVVAILVGTMLPGSLKADMETALIDRLGPSLASVFALTPNLIDQFGHFVFFALLTGGTVLAALPGTWRLLVLLVLFAVATEVLQLLVEGRMPSLLDLAFDTGGMVTGLVGAVLGRLALSGMPSKFRRHRPGRRGVDRGVH